MNLVVLLGHSDPALAITADHQPYCVTHLAALPKSAYSAGQVVGYCGHLLLNAWPSPPPSVHVSCSHMGMGGLVLSGVSVLCSRCLVLMWLGSLIGDV